MNHIVLSLALSVATDAHAGQVDKAGEPYILHPMRVALTVDPWSIDACVTGLLHDVMEDSNYTKKDLLYAGIPEHIVEALCLLTHAKNEPYMDYIQRLKNNDLARTVKIADLRHNSDLSRLPKVTQKDLERAEKYENALLLLKE